MESAMELTEATLELMPRKADIISLQRADLTFDHIHLIQWSRVQCSHLIVLKKLCDMSVWFKIFNYGVVSTDQQTTAFFFCS